jgi:sugar phosphate isomerase/epimerase
MKSSRRTFIKTGGIAFAATAIMRQQIFAADKSAKKVVGLQLYSVREEMLKDPLGSLKQLAAMGYVYLEHANYIDRKFYGYSATDFKKVLDDLGLKMISGHTIFGPQNRDEVTNDFSDAWKYTVEDAAILQQKYMISPWIDEKIRDSYDNLKHLLDVFNKCGELCIKNGMKFGYHNHAFEFSQKLNDKRIFDIMMNTIDPKLVVMQLDIGNLYNGGAIALDIVKQYPGRFENLHVKDEIKATGDKEEYVSCVLGKGIISCKEVVDLATKIGGTTCYIIEQEAYQGISPMESVKEDLAVMKKWGY